MSLTTKSAPQVTLTIYLLKAHVSGGTDALRDKHRELEAHLLDGGGALYVAPVDDREPQWLGWLSPVLRSRPSDISTSTASGVIILEASGRQFALTFGHGHSMLAPGSFQRRFGLFVALNGVSADKLRGAGARTLTNNRLLTDRQTVRIGGVDDLGLSRGNDVLMSLSGQLLDSGLGTSVVGRDSVRITTRLRPDKLRALCGRLLRLHGQTKYKANFDWVDAVGLVTDPDRIAELESEFVEQWITAAAPIALDVYPPEIPPATVVRFGLGNRKSAPLFGDFVPALTDQIRRKAAAADDPVHALKVAQLTGRDESREAVAWWNIWDCLNAELVVDGKTYLLDAGVWLEIEARFAKKLEQDIAAVKSSGIAWPTAGFDESEEDYNKRAAGDLEWVCMDQQFGKLEGYSEFEFCDVLGDGWVLCHVKKRATGSAGLSHAVLQAAVSAEALNLELEARKQCRDKAISQSSDAIGKFEPDSFSLSDATIVLGIITNEKSRVQGVSKFPFFAKLVLRQQLRLFAASNTKVFVDVIPAAGSADGAS